MDPSSLHLGGPPELAQAILHQLISTSGGNTSEILQTDWSSEEHIGILEAYREECEKQGLYEHAETAHLVLKEIRARVESQHLEAVRNRQISERLGLEKAHMEEFQRFQDRWSDRLQEYDQNSEMLLRETQEKHRTEMEEYLMDLQYKLEKPHLSPRLLNLRSVEQTLVRQHKYRDAQRVKLEADELEQIELSEWNVKKMERIALLTKRLLEKQQRDLDAVEQRIASGRLELERQEKLDAQRLLRRYQNIRQGLTAAQNIERSRTDTFLEKHRRRMLVQGSFEAHDSEDEETPSVLSTSRSSVLPSLVPYSSASKQPPSLPKSGSRRGRIRMSASGIDKSRKSSHTGAQRSYNTSSTAFQTLQDLLLAIRPSLQPQYETEMVPMRPDEEDLMTPVPSTAPSSRLDTASSSRVLRSSEGYGSPRNYQIEHIVAPKAVKSRSSVPRPPRPVSASSSVSSRSAASYSPSVSPGRMDRVSSTQPMTADEAAAHVSRVLSSVYSSVESLPAGHSVEGHQYSGKDRQNYRLPMFSSPSGDSVQDRIYAGQYIPPVPSSSLEDSDSYQKSTSRPRRRRFSKSSSSKETRPSSGSASSSSGIPKLSLRSVAASIPSMSSSVSARSNSMKKSVNRAHGSQTSR